MKQLLAKIYHAFMSALVWVLTAEDRRVEAQLSALSQYPEFEREAAEAHARDLADGGNKHMHKVLDRWGY